MQGMALDAERQEIIFIVHLAMFSQLVPPSRIVQVVYPVSEAFTFWVMQFEISALQ